MGDQTILTGGVSLLRFFSLHLLLVPSLIRTYAVLLLLYTYMYVL